jgi:hypothetical protein
MDSTATTEPITSKNETDDDKTVKAVEAVEPDDEEDDEAEECYCGGSAEWCSENCKKSDIDEVFFKINGRLPTSLEIFDDLFNRWREANAQRKLRGDAECDCKKSYCTSCVRRT